MSNVIDLPEILDTSLAPGLAARLTSAEAGDIIIEGQRVQSLGSLCAQVLVQANLHAKKVRRNFVLTASPAMLEDLRLLGLEGVISNAGQLQSGDIK